MKLHFGLSPFVHQSGTIDVPDDLPEVEWEKYINENLSKASLEEMDISYNGIDIDYIEKDSD